ncbi:hypothetical protein GCM10020367_72060 [Streptomyces sannanensis]|uniref:Aminoglycoside phosphotransferase domain-containing protein n=1 Tax=Streptomyces sannanensis TaxID=285536 RepID=A0ABP6SP54_9ACTN
MNVEQAAQALVFAAPPGLDDQVRMRRAHAVAARHLQVTPAGAEVWGWQGHTLGRRAGTSWLRVVSTPADRQGGRLWEGTALADALVHPSVPRPRLRGLLDWTCGEHAYRAELTEYVTVPLLTNGSPVLDRDVTLPDTWWNDLRTALTTLATVPTDREAVRQRWIDRNFRRFLGIDPIQIRDYTTGHADLHWANLTAAPLVILDWEGWGRYRWATSSTRPPDGPGNSSPSDSSSRRAAEASTPTSPHSSPNAPNHLTDAPVPAP